MHGPNGIREGMCFGGQWEKMLLFSGFLCNKPKVRTASNEKMYGNMRVFFFLVGSPLIVPYFSP